ncbi:MAG: class II fructose-bisphosphate aldolase [Verrucomicrobia bacterium]|nr:class II fructose-bisphosphate aldolase [Verrucomicrobiota bacterium]
MPLEPIATLMGRARAGRFAVGYFESWSVDSLQGVIDAAESTRSPVILGFNGEFLSRAGRVAAERLEWYGALGRAAAESAKVPCGLIFNECPNDAWVIRAAEVGFNLVMPADPAAPPDDYVRRVQAITRVAHARGVAVEAELGELPCGTGDGPGAGGSLTGADAAAGFVAATGVDLLAVSVGNVHIKLHGQAPLDLDRLGAISRRVDRPLVLHGGTGIDAASLRAAIGLGVAKVNYGTYLKQRYLAALRAALAVNEPNPHELLGLGGARDVLVAGRLAVRDAVLERIDLLGCCGKA